MRTFVLDTNVILHDSDCIFKFQEHKVVIPITVLEELDHFKKEQNELGRNARHFARYIDELRMIGPLTEGVPINGDGGRLVVALMNEDIAGFIPFLDMSVADNRILAIAKVYSVGFGSYVTLVTKDVNLRIKADALGVRAEDYNNSKVKYDELYKGIREVNESDNVKDFNPPLAPNEFVIVTTNEGDKVIMRYVGGKLGYVLDEVPEAWGLQARNEEQRCALELLLDDNIKLVTLVGKAGTGKSLLAIAAGLRKVTDDFVYRKVLVSRPVMPMGRDIGYLPGSIEEKLTPYMQPIYDNIEFLMSGYVSSDSKVQKKLAKKTSKKKKSDEPDEKDAGVMSKGHLELMNAGILEIEPLIYIRGRSIPKQWLIVDEAQSLTPLEVKTIITRAGEGTKIVFTGDPEQIDNPYVDASSNGLTYIVDRFRNVKIAGHVTLTKCERSELAELAAELL